MNRRADFAAAVRPFGPNGKIPLEAIPALNALADALGLPADSPAPEIAPPPVGGRLGSLSAEFESGGRGPGTVSGGQGDPGGVSYGTYQLASKTGTAAAFVEREGAVWPELRAHTPGSVAFSTAWRAIAARDATRFDEAQHAFIERTHYSPAVKQVLLRTGVDLDAKPQAIRDAVWSVSVQHGKAVTVLLAAIAAVGTGADDETLLRSIYSERSAYVRRVAAGLKSPNERRTLQSIVENRYPKELAKALAMLGG